MRIQKEKIGKKVELSKVYYVDAQGRLCKNYTFWEKLFAKITLAFRLLPFMVTFIIFGLMAVEIACFVGLYDLMTSPKADENSFKIYVIVISLIGIILFFGVKVGFILAEKHLQENQDFFKPKKSKNQ